MKRGDILVLALVAAIALGGLAIVHFTSLEDGIIVIQVEGEDRYVFPLHEAGRDELLEVRGRVGSVFVHLGDGRVRVVNVDCPDKLCEAAGWISTAGRPIACLPNRVIVIIRGVSEDYDFITR